MKKEYEAPKAEKLEFDYNDTVTASQTNTQYNNDPNGQYYKCQSTNYWGC